MRFKTFYKDCLSIQKRFSEYLDGMLKEDDRQIVHDHVRTCQPCSQELDKLSRTISALADFREASIPAAAQTFRLPRSTFVEIFPTIQEEEEELSMGLLAPYFSAALLFFLAISTWITWQQHAVPKQELDFSNYYVEVVAKS